jgi:hypothetical protein
MRLMSSPHALQKQQPQPRWDCSRTPASKADQATGVGIISPAVVHASLEQRPNRVYTRSREGNSVYTPNTSTYHVRAELRRTKVDAHMRRCESVAAAQLRNTANSDHWISSSVERCRRVCAR